MEKTVIIMVSCSGGGKSYYTKKHLASVEGSVVVSADHFFGKDGEYDKTTFKPERLGDAHAACKAKFLDYAKKSKPLIVVDNTNTTARERDFYIKVGKQYGYKVMVDVLDTDIETCIARNVHEVPEQIIRAQAARIDLKPGFYEI